MTGKMAIVGDGDSIMVFKAAGVATFPAENEKKAPGYAAENRQRVSDHFPDGGIGASARRIFKAFRRGAYPWF